MNSQEWLTQLSQLTQVPYYPNHALFEDKAGSLIGVRDGYLVALGLGKAGNGQSAVKLLLRYGKSENPQLEDSLKAAKGKFGELKADDSAASAARTYSFGKPEPQETADSLTSLLTALRSSAVPALAGHCEHCQRSENQITLFDGVPAYVCSNCQQQIQGELSAAGAQYEQMETNYPQGLLYGVGAAIAGGLAWGLVAYAINTILLWGAIGIGYLVGQAVVRGMGKVTWPGRILMGVLTVASVLFGDLLFYTLSVMKEQGLPFSFGLVMEILSNFVAIETESEGGLASVGFALVGAGIVIYSTRRPEFHARFEPLGEPALTAAK